jgi:Flp pilus assembly protein TadG
MLCLTRLRWTKLRKGDGTALVEFAIGSSVLILLLLGVIEFGYLWYQKQVITNASREGARYGVTYKTTSTEVRLSPQNLSPSIQTVVSNYLNGRIPSGSFNIAVSGNGYSATNGTEVKGLDLIVQVSCQNQMDLLSGFIPSLADITFTAKTIMKCE